MPFQIEGRISLALRAYTTHLLLSLPAAAGAYDVPFETFRRRRSGIQSRAESISNTHKFSNNEEEVLFRKILQLSDCHTAAATCAKPGEPGCLSGCAHGLATSGRYARGSRHSRDGRGSHISHTSCNAHKERVSLLYQSGSFLR